MTEKQKFIEFMKKSGFAINDNISGYMDLVPVCQKDTEGNLYLISDLWFCMFDGVNTKPGNLGCVTFYYSGKEREKYHKQINKAEILKKAFCPKDSGMAINTYLDWQKTTQDIRKTWKTII